MGAADQDSGLPEARYTGGRFRERDNVQPEGLGERPLPVAQLEDDGRGVVEPVDPQRFGMADHEAHGEFGYFEARGALRLVVAGPGREGLDGGEGAVGDIPDPVAVHAPQVARNSAWPASSAGGPPAAACRRVRARPRPDRSGSRSQGTAGMPPQWPTIPPPRPYTRSSP